MKFLHLISFLLCITFHSSAQWLFDSELSSTRLVNVKVMYVKPQPSGNISIVFRAQTRDGNPVWDLKKEDLIVTENGQSCSLLNLEPISKNQPIHIALVIDHSGSMSYEFSWENLWKWIRNDTLSIISPLENAKKGSIDFVSTFNPTKDHIGLIGFGEKVDLIQKPISDTVLLKSLIQGIQIDGSTALNDGIVEGINIVKHKNGINIVVALTDGYENASKSTLSDVIKLSKKEAIPLYMIGLGNVDVDTLQYIANQTRGDFHYTSSSESLSEIYKKISNQIQSFYVIEYHSTLLNNPLPNEDSISIRFTPSSKLLLNDITDPAVLEYLEKEKFNQEVWYWGKITVTVLVIGGVIYLVYRYKRRKKAKGN
ncbi:MAG: VWA domain-containing protein [Cytophagaceae bacterium]